MTPETLNLIKKHEGFRPNVYKCTAGYDTIAYGKRIEYLNVSEKIGEEWLKEDCDDIEVKLCQKFSWFISSPPKVQSVVLDMCYQMGVSGFSKFKKTISFIEHGEYALASKEMLDSKWAKEDSPNRAKENSDLMASCREN